MKFDSKNILFSLLYLLIVFNLSSCKVSRILVRENISSNLFMGSSNEFYYSLYLKNDGTFFLEKKAHLYYVYTKGNWALKQKTITLHSYTEYTPSKIKVKESYVENLQGTKVDIYLQETEMLMLPAVIVQIDLDRTLTQTTDGQGTVIFEKECDSLITMKYFDEEYQFKKRMPNSNKFQVGLPEAQPEQFYMNEEWIIKRNSIITNDGTILRNKKL
ncbi:MAG: hypothetical protein AAFP89_26985 [Bacteroidota bacterium]